MSPESSIHHCALAVKRQAQPAVGVLLRKVCFSVRTVPIHARTATGYRGGTGRTDVPRSGNRTEPTRRESRTYRIFHIESPRYARYTSTMESIGRRPTLTRRRPWRSGTVAPSGPVRPAAGSGRRAVPSDSGPGLVVASAPACAFGFRRSYSHGALPAQYS